MEKRESFQSRLGFLLVSAGCAVGIGNVWKFPYVVGQNGGGWFVLMYLLFLVIYMTAVFAYAQTKYTRARKEVKRYNRHLKRLIGSFERDGGES